MVTGMYDMHKLAFWSSKRLHGLDVEIPNHITFVVYTYVRVNCKPSH